MTVPTISIPSDATDNRTYGLVNTKDDYPDGSAECRAECRTLAIYNNNNNNNSYYNSKNNVHNISNDNDYDPSLENYHNSAPTRSKSNTIIEGNTKNEDYVNNDNNNDGFHYCNRIIHNIDNIDTKNNNNSKNNVDNNSNNNDHDLSLQDYYNSSVPTRSKPDTAIRRNTKHDNNKGNLGCSHGIVINDNNN